MMSISHSEYYIDNQDNTQKLGKYKNCFQDESKSGTPVNVPSNIEN